MAQRESLEKELRELLPLTPAVFFVLFALARGEKHGYAIMQEVRTLSNGSVRMGPGTLYSTIQRLLDLDLIEETDGPSGAAAQDTRRRYYRVTGQGGLLLEAEIARLDAVVRLARKEKLTPKAVS